MTDRTKRTTAQSDAKTHEQFHADLLRLRRACGCREAVAAMLLAAIGAAYFTYSDGSPNVTLTIGGAAFGGALIGKITGLLVARIRLHVLLREIEHANGKQAPARIATAP